MRIISVKGLMVPACTLILMTNQSTNATYDSDIDKMIRELSAFMNVSKEVTTNHMIDAARENNMKLDEMVKEFYVGINQSSTARGDSPVTRTKRFTPWEKSGYLLPPAEWSHGHVGLFGESDTIIAAPGNGKISRKISRTENGLYVNLYDTYLAFVGSTEAKRGALKGAERLIDLPYNSSLNNKKCSDGVVNCSQLVWCAYQWSGYDVDSNGGRFVSPSDILNSSYFERTRY